MDGTQPENPAASYRYEYTARFRYILHHRDKRDQFNNTFIEFSRKRKRSKGRMCCVVFLRNASVFLNYLIVVAAFIAGIMVIYVYLSENDREVENVQNTFYTLRAASIIHLILAILVSSLLV